MARTAMALSSAAPLTRATPQAMAPRGAEGKYEVSIGSAWANVNNRSHFNSPHMHPGVQLSGVYYVDDGGDRDGGLCLIDP